MPYSPTTPIPGRCLHGVRRIIVRSRASQPDPANGAPPCLSTPSPPAARFRSTAGTYTYFSLPELGERFDLTRLPYSMKILLENLLRHEDGGITVGKDHIEAVAHWDATKEPDTEIAFMPARVVLQDFTGVPCVVDLAAMRDAMQQARRRAPGRSIR